MNDSVRCIVCGNTFMIVLTNKGTAYAIGRGECGQLGISPSHKANICKKNNYNNDNKRANSLFTKQDQQQLEVHEL